MAPRLLQGRKDARFDEPGDLHRVARSGGKGVLDAAEIGLVTVILLALTLVLAWLPQANPASATIRGQLIAN